MAADPPPPTSSCPWESPKSYSPASRGGKPQPGPAPPSFPPLIPIPHRPATHPGHPLLALPPRSTTLLTGSLVPIDRPGQPQPPLATPHQTLPTPRRLRPSSAPARSLTLDDELSKVGNTSTTRGLGHAAVQVLLGVAHGRQRESGQEAPMADVTHSGGGHQGPALPLQVGGKRVEGSEG